MILQETRQYRVDTVFPMNADDISKKGQKLVGKVVENIEQAGKDVANQASKIVDGRAEEVTEEAIQTAVGQALNILEIAGDEVREKRLDAERVSLQVEIGISGIAQLKIAADVPSDANSVDVEVS